MAKQFDDLDFSDRFIFGRVMEDPDLCRDFLSVLLQEDIGKLTSIVREKEISIIVDGKTIRLDLCATEESGTVYDAEMQNLYAKRSVESLHLPLRSRAYQSMIDNDLLDKGMRFKDLPDCNVIFICTFDPFKQGKYLYAFENICTVDTSLRLEDRARRLFFNVTSEEPNMPAEIRQLFSYFMTHRTESDLTRRINYAVERVKRNSEERSQYMHIFFPDDIIDEAKAEAEAEFLEKGIEQGIEQKTIEFYHSCLQHGMSEEEAVSLSGITQEMLNKNSPGRNSFKD